MALFLIQEAAYLILNGQNNTQDLKNYRPIIFLSHCTKCVAQRIQINTVKEITSLRLSKGLSDVCIQAYDKKRNLFILHADYETAFDSVQLKWLLDIVFSDATHLLCQEKNVVGVLVKWDIGKY